MLIYGICYYFNNQKIKNIQNHITCFKRISNANDTFSVCVMIDSHDLTEHDTVKNYIEKIIKENNMLNFKVFTCFNYGGTVLGLWKTFEYYKTYTNHNIAFFEEDFHPINTNWLNDSNELLKTNKYIY